MADGIKNFGGNVGRCDLYMRRIMEQEEKITSNESHDSLLTEFESLSVDDRRNLSKTAESKGLAIAYLMGGDPHLYGELVLGLQNQYLLNNDQFPNTLTEAFNLLSNYLMNPQKYADLSSSASRQLNGLSFLQHGE